MPRSQLSVVLPIIVGVVVLVSAAVLSDKEHASLARHATHVAEVPHPLHAAAKTLALAVGLGAVVLSALQLMTATAANKRDEERAQPAEVAKPAPTAPSTPSTPSTPSSPTTPTLTPAWAPWASELALSPHRYFGIDVECAATGPRHTDRAPCRVAIVSCDGQVLLDTVVRVEGLVSALTPVTGLTREQIEASPVDLHGVRDAVRKVCGGAGAVLVGQSVQHDLAWLRLRPGVDYGSHIDLAEVFTCWPDGAPAPRVSSLAHEAMALLGWHIQTSARHSPVEDAQVSIRLLLHCANSTERVKQARNMMARAVAAGVLPPRVRPPPRVEGVCMGMWSKTCTCDPEKKAAQQLARAANLQRADSAQSDVSGQSPASGTWPSKGQWSGEQHWQKPWSNEQPKGWKKDRKWSGGGKWEQGWSGKSKWESSW